MKNALTLAACCLCLSSCTTTPMAPAAPAGPSATAVMRPASGSQAHGSVRFTQMGDRVKVEGEIAGLSPGRHGFHVHEKGDCSAPDAASAGAHFNPGGKKHGGTEGTERHGGDLGNLVANEYGKAEVSVMVGGISVGTGANGVIGKGVVVHADPDDMKSDPAGNSGDRIACGAIEA
jgi:Cu-Zn family superoxide dismutase